MSSINEFTSLDNAYPEVKFEFSRTMYPVQNNTQYKQAPPITSNNKQVLATIQPEAENNNALLSSAGITSNWQYRKYLTDNASDLIEYNYRESNNENNFAVRQSNPPNIQCNEVKGEYNVPRLQHDALDASHRFGKPASDLKNMYLNQANNDLLKIAPVITPENVIRQRSE
jgi:hypothetical protein